MSFEQRDIIRHEDVVINDDQIVLPSESKTVPKRCHESWGISGELPEEMHAFVEEMGITCEDIEFCKFQEYNEEERGVIGGQCFLSRDSLIDLTVSRKLARRVTLYNQLPRDSLVQLLPSSMVLPDKRR